MTRSFRLLAVAFLAVALMLAMVMPQAEAGSGKTLTGYTTTPPTIDGIIHSNEWSTADEATFGPITVGAQSITGTLYMMNDGQNLYIAVSIEGDNDFNSPNDGFRVFFDNNHGGGVAPEQGDDDVIANGALAIGDLFYDTGTGTGNWDNLNGGTSDGQSSGSRQGSSNQFELSHPLNDADDTHDFSLSLGQTVGFSLHILVDDNIYDLSAFDLGSTWPSLHPSAYANYLVASQPTPTQAVGGVVTPANKLMISAPYLALIGLATIVVVGVLKPVKKSIAEARPCLLLGLL